MNCDAVKEMLWAYLEKETTAEETVKIEEHLKNCGDCREELKFQQEMMETLSGLPDEELPDGYHAELMQKLQAEATPNVVPFPVKKKKQPVWKQWGMVAAAVLVVVAAGGMNGMLEMRESQNAAVQEMQVDMAESIAAGEEEFAVYDSIEDAEEGKKISSEKNKKMTATNQTPIMVQDEITVHEGAVEESMPAPFSIARMTEVILTDQATLKTDDIAIARTGLEKAVAIAEGYEEVTAEENTVVAVIPVENYDIFVREAEKLGKMEWTKQEAMDENAAFRTIEIRLN